MSPLLLLVALASAAESRALSIEEALRITQDASEAIDIAEAGVDGAIADGWTARSSYLPTVSARGQYTRTFATEYSRLFGDTGGGGLGSSLPFGQENTYRFDFTASQTLYGGGRQWAQTRMAAASRSSADLALEAERASAALTTAQAYYDAALADRVLAIREAALAQAEVTFGHVKLAFEEGHQAEFEVLRAQVDVENQRVAVIRQRRLHDTAQVRLAQQLDLPTDQPLELTTALEPADAVVSAAVSTSGVVASEERAAVQQVANLEVISQSGIAIARSQALPSLVLSGSLGWTHYPDSAIPKTDLDLYYKNASAGLTLSIPLFSGGRVYGGLLAAQADLATAQAQLARTQELADLDTRDAELALTSAEAQWAATEGTVKQAERAYAIAEVRFAEGLSTQTELADARLLLQQAQANRAQAARDLQVARIRTALLPALPIGAGASY